MTQDLQQENKLKIVNPERIARILQRITQSTMQVVIRTPQNPTVTIKSRAVQVELEGPNRGLKLVNISEKGMEMIAGAREVRIEFIMMSAMVIFAAKILTRDTNALLISIPMTLVSIERRKNARYVVTQDLMAFISFGVYQTEASDPTSAPYFEHFRDVGTLISIADMSIGGVCAKVRFPGLNSALKRGFVDEHAMLVLPMSEPIPVILEVRWAKRIKELKTNNDGAERTTKSYRYGLEFRSQSDAAQLQIRQFLQRLSQADAI